MKFNRVFTGLALAAALTVSAAAPSQAGELNDLQIAHIAYTAGNIDIRYAHLAMAKSNNPQVRQFASVMLRDHPLVNTKAGELLEKLNAAPQDNETSKTLIKQSEDLIAEMSALSGAEFDRRYAENELAYHQFVNETVESAFIPAAKNEEFKALLGQALEIFKAHEAHAERLVTAVNSVSN